MLLCSSKERPTCTKIRGINIYYTIICRDINSNINAFISWGSVISTVHVNSKLRVKKLSGARAVLSGSSTTVAANVNSTYLCSDPVLLYASNRLMLITSVQQMQRARYVLYRALVTSIVEPVKKESGCRSLILKYHLSLIEERCTKI